MGSMSLGAEQMCHGVTDGSKMKQIHVLDSETIDKIAAGEVVERPASVVKELVENAIDAGATAITVEAKDGGIEFIRVTDNGAGIEPEQLRTAFLRHATSKIENADDLTRISSLGFRGEALSSIAAVSKVEVITKRKDKLTGTRIVLEGAIEKSFEEVGAPDGTTFLVRNLFYNTPVRRKFLKQPATEGGYIADLMEHLALSRPDISFKFVLGNQTRFHTSGNGDLREVIYRIYGREIASALVPIQVERSGVRIEGYLGKPILVRSNRNFEIYYINGRFIKSMVMAKAIEEGYKEYLMQHKFPLCVLHITMDTEAVDVNVHPTKMDVRFSDALGFCNLLSGAVRDALKNREMIPDAVLDDEKERKNQEQEQLREARKERTPELFEHKREEKYRVMEEARYQAERPKTRDFRQNPVWSRVLGGKHAGEQSIEENADAAMDVQAGLGERKTSSVENKQEEMKAFDTAKSSLVETYSSVQKKTDNSIGINKQNKMEVEAEEELFFIEAEEDITDQNVAVSLQTANEQNTVCKEEAVCGANAVAGSVANVEGSEVESESLPQNENGLLKIQTNEGTAVVLPDTTGTQMNLFEEKMLTVENRARYQIIGQVFDTYWLVQFEDKLFIIDQHAAHEKVKYERLMKQFHEKNVVSQTLMPPIIVSLTGQEESVLREYQEVFHALGFEVEVFGGNEYALRSVPVDLYGCSEREMFLEVLDELSDGVNRSSFKIVEEKIASMSCKAAVKGNNRLSRLEAEELIDELLTLENPYNCPHGRPTIVSMSKYEMEKKFKRIV